MLELRGSRKTTPDLDTTWPPSGLLMMRRVGAAGLSGRSLLTRLSVGPWMV
ncbi:hypothetical protein LINPERPRIM_LOCUS1496 [Linum perenne]